MTRSLTRALLLLVGGAALLGGCVDPYPPDVPAAAQSYLVVDGFINSKGSTTIKLSRSLGLASASAIPAETKATVYVLDNLGTRYNLTENPAGTYTLPAQTLDPQRQYQVRITTAKGRNYASDLVAVKTTPPIDKLSWQPTGNGVEIDVNAHDATGNSRYYRWDEAGVCGKYQKRAAAHRRYLHVLAHRAVAVYQANHHLAAEPRCGGQLPPNCAALQREAAD
jgi:hypothetical protein